MMTGVSGMNTYSYGDVSGVGGNSAKAQEFAQNICTKLGACQAAGQDVAITSPSSGRSR